jgi:hypothetical protein
LQHVIQQVHKALDAEIKVSFGVYEAFTKLSSVEVEEMRGLDLLKEAKSNFVASFSETGIKQILDD